MTNTKELIKYNNHILALAEEPEGVRIPVQEVFYKNFEDDFVEIYIKDFKL